MMLRRLFLIFSLALVFSLGQQGAAVHEISHYADLASTSQQQDKAPHSPICDQCLSYGALTNALDTADFSLVLLASVHEVIQHADAGIHSSPNLYAYSARAPPTLV
jgi:hypothetical protein